MPSNKALISSRKRAFLAQGGRCCYCQARTWLKNTSELEARAIPRSVVQWFKCTAEHAVPRKDGGGNGPDNIRAACRLCNLRRQQRKRQLSEAEYARFVRLRVAKGRWWPASIHRALTG